MTKLELLDGGCQILNEVMLPYGFIFEEKPSGESSGGAFASGEYIKGQRSLEIHLRYSLGRVSYHMGSISLTHEDYMRALLGKSGQNKYPGFSDDPLDGFRCLKYDLKHFCHDFLDGSVEK